MSIRIMTTTLLVALIAALPAQAREFLELKTEHYVIYSSLSEGETRRFANDIAALQAAVGLITSVSDFRPSAAPMRIYALSRNDWRDNFRPVEGAEGFHAGGQFDRYIIFNADHIVGRQIALHEYVHYVVSNAGGVYPAWFNEGLAETLRTIEQTSKTIRVGVPPAGRAQVGGVEGRWIPVQRLMRVKHGDREFRDSQLQNMMYSESWGLVHMYLMGGSTPMLGYLRRVAPGAKGDIDEAFRTSFGMSYEEMDAKLKAYTGARTVSVLTIDKQRLPALVANTDPIRELSKLESDYEFAELALALGKQKAEAREMFEDVLQRDPKHAAAWSGLAEANFVLNDLERARAALTKALEVGTKDPVVLRRAAFARFRNEATREEGIAFYRQALANDPTDIRTIFEYANAALTPAGEKYREDALRYVTTALRAAPKNWLLARSYAALLTDLGRPEPARVGWQVVARYTSDERLRERALQALGQATPSASTESAQ